MNINYKLVNITLITLITYILIKSSFILNKILYIFLPILISFVFAYFLYPIITIMNKKIPKGLSIGILLFVIVFLIFLILFLLIPLLYTQGLNIIDYLIVFIKDVSFKFNIDLTDVENSLISIFNSVFSKISNGAIKTINTSINFVTKFIVAISSFIYFLIDMDKIRSFFKNILKDNNKIYLYLKALDIELKNYSKGLLNLLIITFFEYTIFYYFIGHPNALLLGTLSSISNLIPCFGALTVQVLAFITSFVVSKKLGIEVLIITFILSIFDSYIINPLVYGKSNKIHPIVVISSIFIGGSLFGFVGILFALPFSIIVITTFKFFKGNKIV